MLHSSAHKHNFCTHNLEYAKLYGNKNVWFPSAHLCQVFRLLKRIIFFLSCNYASVTYACKQNISSYLINNVIQCLCMRSAKIACAFHDWYRYWERKRMTKRGNRIGRLSNERLGIDLDSKFYRTTRGKIWWFVTNFGD